METLKPVTCILIKYDCLGKGAHTSFYYKNEIKTIGGIARELCEKNVKPNSVLTFYHAADDSFYFTKDTFPERYLLFTVIGIAICFIPSLTKRVDDAIFRKSINHYSNPKNIKK
ncbi:MAG: hypothetical protein EOO46_15725 [Flavobacterium sp.]|nr:MAG: hypothetical protein EOO46_15725 [Flavobacterium sp.]